MADADSVSMQNKMGSGTQLLEASAHSGGLSAGSAKRSGIEGLEPVIDLEQFEEVMAENSRLVKENPQQAALLIRYWLNDGKL